MKGNNKQRNGNKQRSSKGGSRKGQDQKQVQQATTAEQKVERTIQQWREIFPKYPRDADDVRYVQAYDPSDEKGIVETLRRFGVVVVNVLTPVQASNGLTSLAEELNSRSHAPIDLEDPNTWEDENWPSSRFLTGDVSVCTGAFDVRTNANVKRVFRSIYGTDRLLCSIDHFGLMRGTVGLKFKDKHNKDKQDAGVAVVAEHKEQKETEEEEEVFTMRDRPDWRQRALRAHWDVNPVAYTKEICDGLPRRYQGIVAMDDCPEETGGFCCVPGSAAFLEQWLQEGCVAQGNKYLPANDIMHQFMQRFPLRKGQMVIWDYGQAHANFENHSSKMRLILFVRYLPAMDYAIKQDNRSPALVLDRHPLALQVRRQLKNTLSREDLRLFGLEPYEN